MVISDLIKKYNINSIPGVLNANQLRIPVTQLEPSLNNVEMFNELYQCLIKDKNMRIITRTRSGGICTKRHIIRFPSYDVIQTKTKNGAFKGLELTILTGDAMCRIQFASKPSTELSGTVAFRIFRDICRKFKINLDDYAVSYEEGYEAKQDIKEPLIRLANGAFRNIVFSNAHHLDFHSSYPTGLINTHPEFKEAITFMYDKRHENKVFKEVLNSSIGYMQSQWTKYKYTTLARDAINDNYRRITELASKLKASGRTVISYNTDGIWYAGDIYHDDNEGSTLGTWENDHVNCKFRAKSDGAYEFIEDSKYHAVVRGKTLLDRVKSRDTWSWGDIYSSQCSPIVFAFKEGVGIVYEEKCY